MSILIKYSLLHHVLVDEGRHEGDGECARALTEDLPDILVLQSYHILAIDFSQVVINQNTIPRDG